LAEIVREGRSIGGIIQAVPAALISQVALSLSNLLLIRAFVERFDALYGAYLACSAVLSFPMILELGIGLFLVREAAGLSASSSESEMRRLFSTVVFAHAVVGAAVMAIGLLACVPLVEFIAPEATGNEELVKALRWYCLQIGIAVPLVVGQLILQGLRKLVLVGWLTTFGAIISLLCVLGLLNLGHGLSAMPIGFLAASVIISGVAFGKIPVEVRRCLAVWPWPDREMAGRAWKYCRPFFVGKIVYTMKERTDHPIASHFVGLTSVVVYSSTAKLAELAVVLPGLVGNLIFPHAAALIAANRTKELRSLILDMVAFGLRYCVLMFLAVWVVNDHFVRLWVGPEWFGGVGLTLIFGSWIAVSAVTRLLAPVILAAGQTAKVTKFMAVEALLNAVLSLVLVKHFGLLGIAIGTLVSMLLYSAWKIPLTVFRFLEIKSGDLRRITHGLDVPRTGICAVLFVLTGLAVPAVEHEVSRFCIACALLLLIVVVVFHNDWRRLRTEMTR
jgi:O-antigen/teichoic acid export membrane protein